MTLVVKQETGRVFQHICPQVLPQWAKMLKLFDIMMRVQISVSSLVCVCF